MGRVFWGTRSALQQRTENLFVCQQNPGLVFPDNLLDALLANPGAEPQASSAQVSRSVNRIWRQVVGLPRSCGTH